MILADTTSAIHAKWYNANIAILEAGTSIYIVNPIFKKPPRELILTGKSSVMRAPDMKVPPAVIKAIPDILKNTRPPSTPIDVAIQTPEHSLTLEGEVLKVNILYAHCMMGCIMLYHCPSVCLSVYIII